jgi:hypothetical protein
LAVQLIEFDFACNRETAQCKGVAFAALGKEDKLASAARSEFESLVFFRLGETHFQGVRVQMTENKMAAVRNTCNRSRQQRANRTQQPEKQPATVAVGSRWYRVEDDRDTHEDTPDRTHDIEDAKEANLTFQSEEKKKKKHRFRFGSSRESATGLSVSAKCDSNRRSRNWCVKR